MSEADSAAKYDLLYQYFAEDAPLTHLQDGLHLEINKPSFLGVLTKVNTPLELIWKLISLGKCWLFRVRNTAGNVVHQSMLIGWNPKFSFLKKNEYEIGPCYTMEEYRGLGIYPYVLQQITSFMPNNKSSESLGGGQSLRYYMFVAQDNISSRRGVEKAGFKVIGYVQRKHFGLWKRVKD